MAYEMVMPYHLHMPSYFLKKFINIPKKKKKQGGHTPGGGEISAQRFPKCQLFFSFPDVRIHVYCGLTHWYFYPPRRIDIRSFGMLEPTTRHNYRFVHIGI